VNRRSKILCAFGWVFLFAALGIYMSLPPLEIDDPQVGVTYPTVQWRTGGGLLCVAFFLPAVVLFLTGIVKHFVSCKRVS
jgi:hypothetical protein